MSNSQTWAAVDDFFEHSLLPDDPLLDEVLRVCHEAGLPAIQVSPCQAQFLHILLRLCGGQRVLEIGTLGGYSTIALARALPDTGQVVTIELLSEHAAIAESNFARTGMQERIELIQGDAVAVLDNLIAEKTPVFDFIFIDADKSQNPDYLERVLQLARSGTVIVLDNAVRGGAVADFATDDPNVGGVQEYCRQLQHRGIPSTAIQTVGSKGYDGFAISIVT
jgi:predicted O-methyltransferase YrrM